MELLQSQPRTRTSGPTPEASGDDGALALEAKRGDAAAFALLYRRYVQRVHAYAAWRLASREAAEEATQQVFFRALRGLAGYRGETAFAPWLFAIARNVVADAQRAKRRPTASLDAASGVADPGIGPEEQAARAAQHAELLAAREHCLSERERELFDLLLGDLTHQEIATLLGRRQGAVRTAHWRLIGKLRTCLAGEARKGLTDAPL